MTKTHSLFTVTLALAMLCCNGNVFGDSPTVGGMQMMGQQSHGGQGPQTWSGKQGSGSSLGFTELLMNYWKQRLAIDKEIKRRLSHSLVWGQQYHTGAESDRVLELREMKRELDARNQGLFKELETRRKFLKHCYFVHQDAMELSQRNYRHVDFSTFSRAHFDHLRYINQLEDAMEAYNPKLHHPVHSAQGKALRRAVQRVQSTMGD